MQQNKQPNPKQINSLLQTAASQLGMAPDALRDAVQSGSADSILNGMPPEQAAQLRQALNQPDLAAKIMATPQAQAILKKLFDSGNR